MSASLLQQTSARLATVKQEMTEIDEAKKEAVLDLEDQEQTTTQVALTLDRWQSYADE